MKTTSVGAFDAKTHLSQLLDRVAQGEQIEITRRGRPVARLVPSDPFVNTDSLTDLITRVREERGSYKVSAKDVAAWKSEGRR